MVQRFAGIVGALFLLLGIIGLFMHDLFGLIHFDGVHNTVHLIIGAAGLLAAGSETNATWYARIVGFVYVLLGIVGFALPDLFGAMHLETAENVLHLVVGALALFAGFTAQRIQVVTIRSKSN
jgi:multisubunit Na+/H+ antiporter MnhG subunit